MSSLKLNIAKKSAHLTSADISKFQAPSFAGKSPLKQSAILILFGETSEGPDLTFIQRSTTLRHHPGQVGFPGGMVDEADEDEVATALREANEEIALNLESVEIITTLPKLFVPVSQFEVTPVLAHWHSPHEVYPNDLAEVERVERIAISELVDPKNRVSVRHSSGFVGPAFNVRDFTIWGFTGGVLDRLLAVYDFEIPWDENNIVDLDPRYS